MGIKYSKTDGQLLISALNHNLSVADQIVSDLQEGVSRLTNALDSGELSGKAYHAVNTLFKSIIEPTLSKLKNATADVKNDLGQFKSAISAFDHFSDSVYDKDEITHALEIKRQQKATVENQIRFFNDMMITGIAKNAVENLLFEGKQLDSVLAHYEAEIKKLEDKLRILEETSWRTSSLFQDSLIVFQDALKGAKALRKGSFDSQGNFKVSASSDMSWYKQMMGQELDSSLYAKKEDSLKAELGQYNVFALLGQTRDGKPKITWFIEDKKTGLRINNKELYDFLENSGTQLGGDVVQFMDSEEYGKHYGLALDKGYDYLTGKKLNPALWGVREGIFKLGEGMMFMDNNQIAKNLSQLGFLVGAYKIKTPEGVQIVSEAKAGAGFKLAEIPVLKISDNIKVNLPEHIFEGDVTKKGKATGYHSEVITNNSEVVRVTKQADKYGVYEAKVSVNGVEKGGVSTMYPKDWSPQQIMNEVQHAYENMELYKGTNIFRGEASNGMKIEMRIKNGKIESAYPVYNERK